MTPRTELLDRGKQILREEGLIEFIKRSFIYIFQIVVNRPILKVRSLIPPSQNYRIKAGEKIFVHSDHERTDLQMRSFDPFLHSIPGISVPSYSEGKMKNRELIREYVEKGDSVTVIGAGFGETSVEILRKVGEHGSLTAYEGDLDSVKSFQQTIRHHGFEGRATVHHGIVGNAYKLAGGGEEGKVVSPKDLEYCDVLEMDCEGAELDILKNLSIRPRCIIIEQHHHQPSAPFSDPKTIPNLLETLGYRAQIYDGRKEDQLVVGVKK